MAIGNNPERQKGSRALVTKKRSSFQAPQFEELVDISDDDDDEPTMVHTALIGKGLQLPARAEPPAEPPEVEEWHFQISVPMQELERLAELGLVSGETLAWRPGLSDWTRVEEIPQLEESLQSARSSSLRPPRAPQFEGLAADDPATTPFAAPEPVQDSRRAPTQPPQSRRAAAATGGPRPLSVLPPPPVPPPVGARRPGSVPAPPLAYSSTVRPDQTPEQPSADASPLWDLPTSAIAGAPAELPPPLGARMLAAWRASGPHQALTRAGERLGPRGKKIAVGAGACVLVGGVALIAGAAYQGSAVDEELHVAARPALEAAVKQSADAARNKPSSEPAPEAPAADPPEKDPEPSAKADEPPAADTAEPLDVSSLATAESEAPEAEPPATKAAAADPPPAKAVARAPAPAASKGFDAAAARRALDNAAGAASSCVDEGARVPGSITVTFGSNGKVKSAKLGRSLSSPALERCVIGAFRRASVPAFSGPDSTVSKTFRLKG